MKRSKGARKGHRPSQPNPRLYYDYGAASQAVLSRGGGCGADEGGPLRALSTGYFDRAKKHQGTVFSSTCCLLSAGCAAGFFLLQGHPTCTRKKQSTEKKTEMRVVCTSAAII